MATKTKAKSKADIKALITTDPVAAAAALAKTIDIPADPAAAMQRIREHRQKIDRLQTLKGDLLPCEDGAEKLTATIKKLTDEIGLLSRATVPLPATLPLFDTECLRWRDKQGFPRLVPFAPHRPKFVIGIDAKRQWGPPRTPSTFRYTTIVTAPRDLAGLYDDVVKMLRGLRKQGKGIRIEATYSGTIPDDIRAMIHGGQRLFSAMYLVAEVADWKVTQTAAKPAPARKGDPLLIGFDGENYRLIAAFDTTSIEQLARDRSFKKRR